MRVPVADGVALHVHRWEGGGAVPPVLLVHGLASNLRLWDGVAAELARLGHDVAAVDLRGHGRSDAPDQGYSVPSVAADLLAVCDALGWERPLLAGQSWGGNVVLELAWAAPERVRAAVLVDGGWIELAGRFADWPACEAALTPPPLAGRAAVAVQAELRRRHPDWPASGIEGTMACFEVLDDGTVRPWCTLGHHLLALRGLWEHRPSLRYPDVRVPVLLVPAAPGSATTRQEVASASGALPRSTTRWLEGDHDLHAQYPSDVAGLVAEAAGA